MNQTIACSKEEFRALKSKSYRNIPRLLLKRVIKDLPDYACVAYLFLYDLSELNQRHPGTVIISHAALAAELGKSEISVKRAIKTLKTLGYIKIIQQGECLRSYKPNIIEVVCPQIILEHILNEEPDRKASVVNFPKTIIVRENKMSDKIVENNLSPTQHDLDLRLYGNYQDEFKRLRDAGVSPLLASQEAFAIFSESEKQVIQKMILEQKLSFEVGFKKSNLIAEGIKFDPHKNNNNRTTVSLLTIEEKEPDNSQQHFDDKHKVETYPFVVLKNEAIVKILNKTERETIIKKIKAMYYSGEIAKNVLKLHKSPIESLIAEVIHHVQYRDIQKVTSVKHALNACAKMLRKGTWSTPKRFIWQQIYNREQDAWRQKQKENISSKIFFNHNIAGKINV